MTDGIVRLRRAANGIYSKRYGFFTHFYSDFYFDFDWGAYHMHYMGRALNGVNFKVCNYRN